MRFFSHTGTMSFLYYLYIRYTHTHEQSTHAVKEHQRNG